MTDQTIASALKDVSTVSTDGTPVGPSGIEGVLTRSPIEHVDHRGSVFEIFNEDPAFWQAPAVYTYQFSVRPGQVKGWGLHQHHEDRYTLISGELLTLLYDAREDSPTYGNSQKVFLSGKGTRQLIIPRNVWHLNVNLSSADAVLINFPSEPYCHGNPDRLLLPWNTNVIPVNAAEFFPRQWGTPEVIDITSSRC